MLLILSIVTFLITSGIIFWLLIVRKRLFDPRVYVLYGILHWVLFGQLGTFLGYEFFEVKPIFSEETHFKGSLSILVAVVFFLIGYYLPLRQRLRQPIGRF